MLINCIFKKTAHAYYERSYFFFSKSFGGKIETVQTDVTKEKNIPKKSFENSISQTAQNGRNYFASIIVLSCLLQ